MPLYEFECKKCEEVFNELRPMKDAPEKAKCPKCKKVCKRHYGDMNFICKGVGWPSKNIRRGIDVTSSNPFEAEEANRIKKGFKPHKEKPMSNEEFKRRKKNLERFIDEK
jgi:putative FmdB family regulatory protein